MMPSDGRRSIPGRLALVGVAFAVGAVACMAADAPRSDEGAAAVADTAHGREIGSLRVTVPAAAVIDRMPGYPRSGELVALEVPLSPSVAGWTAPIEGAPIESIALDAIEELDDRRFTDAALDAIADAIRARVPDQVAFVWWRELDGPPDVVEFVVDIEIGPYPVSALEFALRTPHPANPTSESLGSVEVTLGLDELGYIGLADRDGEGDAGWHGERVTLRLSEIDWEDPRPFFLTALAEIVRAVRDALVVSHDLMGVYVTIDPEQIPHDPRGGLSLPRDEREEDETSIRLLVFTGIVQEVRTVAFGERIPAEARENHPAHERIRRRSPFAVWDGQSDSRSDLLRLTVLNDYLHRLSRLPGRQVDAALFAAGDGGVGLDYLVKENRPYLLYLQGSNTGTRQTDKWRQRAGLILNQPLGKDDIFSFDFLTAAFDQTNALALSYESALFDIEPMRWRVYGNWNEFTASDVGFVNEVFTGSSWSAGAELRHNVMQRGELFLDVVAGARFMNVDVNNELINLEGNTDFFLPYVGVEIERSSNSSTTFGGVRFEWNVPSIADTQQAEIDRLGRLFVDRNWTTLQWTFNHSFFLEPIIDPVGWRDITTPKSSTLAHEISLRFSGQYAFGNRLIPQAQQVIGGMTTVRGYDESVIAGDTVVVGSAEYRFHLARALRFREQPGSLFGRPFRVVPQEPYGQADWNLAFKAFTDIGRSMISDRLFFEQDATLWSVGVGVEATFLRHLNIRLEWGFPLKDLPGGSEVGSSRVHFLGTLVF